MFIEGGTVTIVSGPQTGGPFVHGYQAHSPTIDTSNGPNPSQETTQQEVSPEIMASPRHDPAGATTSQEASPQLGARFGLDLPSGARSQHPQPDMLPEIPQNIHQPQPVRPITGGARLRASNRLLKGVGVTALVKLVICDLSPWLPLAMGLQGLQVPFLHNPFLTYRLGLIHTAMDILRPHTLQFLSLQHLFTASHEPTTTCRIVTGFVTLDCRVSNAAYGHYSICGFKS